MTTTKPTPRHVFYVPAGVPFVDGLARAVLAGDLPVSGGIAPAPLELANWTILLPTRRASRGLMQAFIEQGDGSARLLPRIQPLGDVDEDELAFSDLPKLDGFDPMPPAISNLEREFLLVSLINKWAQAHRDNRLADMLNDNHIHCFDLARSLGKLVDSFDTASGDCKIIGDLFEGEFAEHRQQILQFLAIIQHQLPEKMTALGKTGPARHRNILMQAYREYLESGKARGPVIAAGSTGSIPATADLLATIAGMDNGAVVLPGLDVSLDDESWQNLPEHHPQFGMQELLTKIGIGRDDVMQLPGVTPDAQIKARNWLVSEIMRPAETTDLWRSKVKGGKDTLIAATSNLTVLDCNDQRGEATTIALIMRQALEGDKTAALITPDRNLARSVKSELSRWQIEVDDSAGNRLAQTPPAVFMQLLLDAASAQFSPVALKTLLAHPFCRFGLSSQELESRVEKFEIAVLRASQPYEGLAGLGKRVNRLADALAEDHHAYPAAKNLSDQDWQNIAELVERLTGILAPLEEIFSSPVSYSFKSLLTRHLETAQAVCQIEPDPGPLWQGEEGGELSALFERLQSVQQLAPDMSGKDYAVFLNDQMAQCVVRSKHVRHGRLAIYGLLEARLISADILVLGGLNETIWPAVAEVDPWLTRPQLQQAGLPVPERKTGLSAHDFAQGFCAPQVYLSYAKKQGGSPAVPARWILRLQALLSAADMEDACKQSQNQPWLDWTMQLDEPGGFEPIARPGPCPALKLRPVTFSVTGIEKLLKNPYQHFAEKILRLPVLDRLDRQAGAIERGNLVHKGLEIFLGKYKDPLPDDPVETLKQVFDQILEEEIPDIALQVFWRPQLARIAEWFIDYEKQLRLDQQASFIEVSGRYFFSVDGRSYQLSGRADRIDVLEDGRLRVIDYKTGSTPSLKPSAETFSPQLFLEALIAAHGGFGDVPKAVASKLEYIKLSGGIPAGKSTGLNKEVSARVEDVEDGLKQLISAYGNDCQPYCANCEPERVDVEREYDYLSRWREWAHLVERKDGQ
jgi:ATP-dependent helicase/nuclease subunit B